VAFSNRPGHTSDREDAGRTPAFEEALPHLRASVAADAEFAGHGRPAYRSDVAGMAYCPGTNYR